MQGPTFQIRLLLRSYSEAGFLKPAEEFSVLVRVSNSDVVMPWVKNRPILNSLSNFSSSYGRTKLPLELQLRHIAVFSVALGAGETSRAVTFLGSRTTKPHGEAESQPVVGAEPHQLVSHLWEPWQQRPRAGACSASAAPCPAAASLPPGKSQGASVRALITSPGSRGTKLLLALPLKPVPREDLLRLSQPAGRFAMAEFPHAHGVGTEGWPWTDWRPEDASGPCRGAPGSPPPLRLAFSCSQAPAQ